VSPATSCLMCKSDEAYPTFDVPSSSSFVNSNVSSCSVSAVPLSDSDCSASLASTSKLDDPCPKFSLHGLELVSLNTFKYLPVRV
jgi:hypothetical protein